MLRRFFVTLVVCMGGATGAWAQLAENAASVQAERDAEEAAFRIRQAERRARRAAR